MPSARPPRVPASSRRLATWARASVQLGSQFPGPLRGRVLYPFHAGRQVGQLEHGGHHPAVRGRVLAAHASASAFGGAA